MRATRAAYRPGTAVAAGCLALLSVGLLPVEARAAAAAAAPAAMRAIVQERRGGPEVLAVSREPVPAPAAGQVRIRVVAAGVNPVDWKSRQAAAGGVSVGPPAALQRIPGADLAGVIDALGPGVEGWRVGDLVIAALPRPNHGTYAEYTLAAAANLVRKPARLGFEEAAALPTPALTAWRMLVEPGLLGPGKRVLIHAGAGGVGSMAIQFAKARGAWVATTASARNHAWLRALGVDQVIDYNDVRFEEVVDDLDVAFDTVGGDYPARSARLLRRGGTLVALAPLPAAECVALGIRCPPRLPSPELTAPALREAVRLADSGQLVVRIDRVLPLEQAAEAQELNRQGGGGGRIVLRIGPPSTAGRPNILLIVADDLGISDLGAWGGEIDTPVLDRLASRAVRLTDYHVGATCSPTRAMLLTGVDHHRSGVGAMYESLRANPQLRGKPGYEGHLNGRVVTIASRMREAGYATFVSGKWHLGYAEPDLPPARGFDRSFVLLQGGAGHFDGGPATSLDARSDFRDDGRAVTWPAGRFSSDHFTDRMLEYLRARPRDQPFFAYLAYTAPHWPLQAPESYLRKYRGRYDAGWDVIRARRLARMQQLGLLEDPSQAAPRPGDVPAWADLTPEQRRRQARLMEIYAAMVDNMDANVGRVLRELERSGALRDTIVVFMSDNGAEEMQPGTAPMPGFGEWVAKNFDNQPENLGRAGSFVTYGPGWAHVSSGPLRAHKGTTFQGGIRAPAFIALPGGRAATYAGYSHVTDMAASLLRFAGVAPAASFAGAAPDLWTVEGRALFGDDRAALPPVGPPRANYELHGNRGVRDGDLKAVSRASGRAGPGPWMLFDLARDPGERRDLATERPADLRRLRDLHDAWSADFGVVPAPARPASQPGQASPAGPAPQAAPALQAGPARPGGDEAPAAAPR